MSAVKGRAALLAVLLALSSCAGFPASAQGGKAMPPEVTNAFRGCYREARLPWLVDLMTSVKDPGTPLEVGLDRLVRGGAEERGRVRGYVEARRKGQYPDIHAMAAAAFNVCMAGIGDLDYRGDRLRGCFAEQEVLFDAMNLRFYQHKRLDEATAITMQHYAGADAARGATVRRLTRDVYTVTKAEGDAPTTSQAEFELCMTLTGYAPSL